jgi:chromosome segregation ATPase
LKIQTENSEAQLDNVREELKLKEEELNKLKKLSEEEIFNLKIQTENSEAQLGNLRKELKLKEEELNKLKARVLVSNRKQIKMVVDAANHEQEMQKLKSEMLDLQDKFSLEKDKLHFDIASLSKMKIELASKLEDCQSRNKELENKLSRDRDAIVEKEMVLEEEMNCLKEELSQNMHLVEAGKKELEMAVIERDEANAKIDKLEAEICSSNDKLKLRATQEMVLQDKINCLREELGQKIHLVVAVNKKMKMVVIERDEANAKIDKLKNDIRSCEDKSANMYNYVKELEASLTDMTVTYKACREEGKVLKLRLEEQLKKVISDKNEEKREAIKELEASLTKMTVIYKAYRDEGKMLKLRLEELKEVISDKDEEKREAIRQLCYSLEYYRSGYRELVQAINKVYRRHSLLRLH